MNNNDDKDKLRFNKLYELLGEEVNSIYNTKDENQIFTNGNDDTSVNGYVIPGVLPTNVNNKKEIISDEKDESSMDNDIFFDNNQVFNDVNDSLIDDNQLIDSYDIHDTEPIKVENSSKDEHIKNKIVLNKTIIDGKNIVDDIDNSDYGKMTIREFFSNHKNVSIILVLAFICVCIVVVKTFYFGNIR